MKHVRRRTAPEKVVKAAVEDGDAGDFPWWDWLRAELGSDPSSNREPIMAIPCKKPG